MIGEYDLEILTPACDPGSPRLVAKAAFLEDIVPVLPYLNATLPGANYLPEAQALIWEDDSHLVAFHANEIAVSEVTGRDDAEHVMDHFVRLVNETWDRRDEIVPSVATLPRPTPMEVYRLLPGTNCKDCHLPGCWQFALKLVTGEARTGDCPALADPEFAPQLAALRRDGVA